MAMIWGGMVWAGRAGRCSVCREMVQPADMVKHNGLHPDAYVMYDTSWNAEVNPDNTPWAPGYRFWTYQQSATGPRYPGSRRQKVRRTYKVWFEIDPDGNLRHVRGPKPTAATLEGMLALYARERPGSNGGPPLEDDG